MLTGRCKEFVEQVTDALEGRLGRVKAARFAAHAALCVGCGAYLAQVRATAALAAELPPPAPAPAVEARLRGAFETWVKDGASRVTNDEPS